MAAVAPALAEHAFAARKRVKFFMHPNRARARWRRRELLKLFHSYLDGLKGVEIGGAAHNDFKVDVLNVDRYPEMDTVYKEAERELWGRARPVDIIARGHDLPLDDDSFDFVLASHVIEHIPDPIAALKEWARVARRYIVLVVPHRDRTFDRDRPLTPLAELIERHESGFASEEDRHWSVWTCETFLELCEHIGFEVLEARDPDARDGNGFAVILAV
jgi:SAM-dependent methyltransferase